MPVDGNRVVITGSSSGIGAAIARQLASEGWTVIGFDLRPASGAPSIAQQIVIDLSDEAETRRVARSLRGVQAIVHAAGFMRTGSLGDLSTTDGEAMWKVHVRALIVLADELCPYMPAGGRLVAIGSRTSAGAANKSQYAACKAAIVALVRSWAKELVGRGVTANVIAPAATATPMLADASRAQVVPVMPPIGRYISPDEIAACVSFILSPAAAAITGQELLICGGASL